MATLIMPDREKESKVGHRMTARKTEISCHPRPAFLLLLSVAGMVSVGHLIL